MSKILVTGGSGFIGQALIPKLAKKHHEVHEVHSIERYVTGRYNHYQRKDAEDQKHYLDLKDYHAVRTLVKELQPEYVIHLAAISPVAYSYDHYVEVSEVNYISTINLAEACRQINGFKQFLFSGTSEEYGLTR